MCGQGVHAEALVAVAELWAAMSRNFHNIGAVQFSRYLDIYGTWQGLLTKASRVWQSVQSTVLSQGSQRGTP